MSLLELGVGSIALAEAPKPPVTKIVFRVTRSQGLLDPFATKPKTLWIAGESYSRAEEAPDPARGIHGLMVTSEPNTWMINLINRTGRHLIDPGPTFVVHHEILKRGAPKEFGQLEFGKEIDFFRAHQTTSLGIREVEQQHCEASEFKSGNYRIILYVSPGTQIPFQIEVYQDEKLDFAIRYLSYQKNLPFDESLFRPPSDIGFAEDPSKRLFHEN